jgi:hypothetical protein
METPPPSIPIHENETDLNAWLLTSPLALHVLFIYADFHAPSKPGGQMDVVVQTLAKVHPTVMFCKLNAETCGTVSELYEVRFFSPILFRRRQRGTQPSVSGDRGPNILLL